MQSPDRQELKPSGNQIGTPDLNLGRMDTSVDHSADRNGDLKARWDVGEDGQVRLIKPLADGRAVVVPFSSKQNGEAI